MSVAVPVTSPSAPVIVSTEPKPSFVDTTLKETRPRSNHFTKSPELNPPTAGHLFYVGTGVAAVVNIWKAFFG